MELRFRRYRPFRWLRWIGIQLLATLLLLLLLEGAAGYRAAWKKVNWRAQTDRRLPAERLHTEYDPLLGWISKPGFYPDLYGKGRHLTITGNGARATPSPDNPPPWQHVVASGDSFTMGYGVDDEATWTAHMEKQHPGLDIQNLGLGGYGLGQSFLRYRRDGLKQPHDLHLFSFITEDYRRLGRDRFMGYGKPVVTLKNGRLALENVPPPRRRYLPLFTMRFGEAIQELHSVKWLTGGFARRMENQKRAREKNVQHVALAIFSELHQLHTEHGRTGVLVHFPVEDDYASGESNGWRNWLHTKSEKNGWIFVDLIPAFRSLPRDQVKSLFIQDDADGFRGARGHYTELGNQMMARALIQELMRRRVLTSPEAFPTPES